MMPPTSRLLVLLLVSAALSLQAQTLESLTQSYEKAVAEKATAPYQAAVAELNRKYSAAIDRLTTAATQAGDLDTALILREEKSRLLPEGTLPEDTETTPATLKAARATYRQQVATLQATRDTAAQPLTQHFITLLQGLLTQATQAGKLDEALIIREKIASLSSKTDPAPPGTSPSKPASPPAGSSRLITAKSTGKTDPEAARQIITWALANDATVTTNLGIIGQGQKLTAAPSGKFSIIEINMAQGANFPWTALEGMGELQKLVLNHDAPLTAEQTRHFHNLGSLRFLKIGDFHENAITAMPVFPALFDLDVRFEENPLPTLHLLQERTANIHRLYLFRLHEEYAEAFFMKLRGWPELARLDSAVKITEPIAAYLAAHSKFNKLLLFTGSTIDEAGLQKLKNLTEVYFNSTQRPAVLQALTTLPKPRLITLDLEGMSIADIPDFAPCKAVTEINLDNTPSPAAEVVSKCAGITGMKIFKLGHTQIEVTTITALLSFKNLEVLSLNDSTFTTEAFSALQQLKAIKTLKELNLKVSGIPAAELQALQKALPRCVIRT